MIQWNQSKSLMLSIFCTRLFMVLVVAAVLFAPELAWWYFGQSLRVLPFRVTIYCCAVPAVVLLLCLNGVLGNLKKGAIFVEENTKKLRLISWCCILLGLIALASGLLYYLSFIIVAVCAAFVGLIVRVVKNLLEQAIEIKSENDFTI